MVRDELMQRVIQKDKEPITPFLERARDLYEAVVRIFISQIRSFRLTITVRWILQRKPENC